MAGMKIVPNVRPIVSICGSFFEPNYWDGGHQLNDEVRSNTLLAISVSNKW